MNYEEMREQLDNYNWDDGFSLPQKIISDEKCDLAMALEVFYLGDGFSYFYNIEETGEWFCFIDNLYEDIKNGKYVKSEHHYKIPLSKVQRYQIAKKNIPKVFLEDV